VPAKRLKISWPKKSNYSLFYSVFFKTKFIKSKVFIIGVDYMVKMKRVMIKDLEKSIGKKVLLKGFLHEIRNQSKVKFVLLRDVSGIIQCVFLLGMKDFEKISSVPRESVLEITGLVKEEKQAPSGIEIQVESFLVLSESEKILPIPVASKVKESALPLRLDFRWIDLRKPKNTLIFKIWTKMEQAMREYWIKNDFIQIHSPKFVAGATESGAELFTLEYFGKKASLAQSPQFYKQMAMASGFEKVFEIGPVFRANKSHTTRHDTEFTSVDMELSFIDSEDDVMEVEEEWIKYFLTKIKKVYGKEIKEFFGVEIKIPKTPFPRIPLKKVLEILKKEFGYEIKEFDLDPKGEKFISKYVKKKFNSEFVFVTDYPVKVRPFYHMRKESNKNITKSFDLIFKGTEITTGSQREHRYEILKKQALEKKVPLEGIKDYLEFFKYGCPSHGGLGLSPSRVLMLLLGLKNVREVTFVPRDTERLKP
jgi:nondiscriminating aspartyl-tRNA synthetase